MTYEYVWYRRSEEHVWLSPTMRGERETILQECVMKKAQNMQWHVVHVNPRIEKKREQACPQECRKVLRFCTLSKTVSLSKTHALSLFWMWKRQWQAWEWREMGGQHSHLSPMEGKERKGFYWKVMVGAPPSLFMPRKWLSPQSRGPARVFRGVKPLMR